MAVGPVVVGSTYRWFPTFLKDGAIYDLTGTTITVNFLDPNGAVHSFAMGIVDALAGTALYQNDATLFTNIGESGSQFAQWYRSYKVKIGSVVLESAPIPFPVYKSVSGA